MIVSIYLVRLSLIHSNMPQNEFPSTKVSEITHIFLIQAIDTQHDDTLIIKLKKLFLFVIFSGATLGNVCL